jgi:hypothetical protein
MAAKSGIDAAKKIQAGETEDAASKKIKAGETEDAASRTQKVLGIVLDAIVKVGLRLAQYAHPLRRHNLHLFFSQKN